MNVLHPQLLEGASAANAPRLTEIVADYKLMSDLSSTYGRIEELRWRLRQRTATLAGSAGSDIARGIADVLEDISRPLVDELLKEVADLLDRVGVQIDRPDVQPIGLLHILSPSGSIRPTGTLTLRKIRREPGSD